MGMFSRADLNHEKRHVKALNKLGVRGKTFYDEKGLYTVQTGGRKLSRAEKAAVMLAGGDGHDAADLRRRGFSAREIREGRALAKRL